MTTDNLRLLSTAKGLASEDGENPEYDRALVELCVDTLGVAGDDQARAFVTHLVTQGPS